MPGTVINGRLFVMHDDVPERTTASGKAMEPWPLPVLPGRAGPEIAGRALFTAYDPGTGETTLWQSDGTPEGTMSAATLGPNQRTAVAADRVFLVADDSVQALLFDCPRR